MASVVVNKTPYDFGTITLDIMYEGSAALSIEGVEEINYSDSVERAALRGTARKVLARTDGEYDGEGSMNVYRYAYRQLVDFARAKGLGIYDLEFDVVVTYAYRDDPVTVDRLVSCKFTSRDMSNQRGADATMVTLEFSLDDLITDDVSSLA